MVAITIGLVLIAALISLFSDISRTNQEMAKVNRQIENARFAIQFLENDIIHAGYFAGFIPDFDDLTNDAIPSEVPTNVPDPCLPFSTPWDAAYIDAIFGIPLQAYNGSPSANCNSVVQNQQANTDVLIVRHANNCVPGDANCEADLAGKLYFQYSRCEIERDAGTPYVLGTSGFGLHERDCVGTSGAMPITAGTVANKRKFIQNLYYIRDFSMTAGDGIPTLVRSEFDLSGGALQHQAPVALVDGIEGVRIELGIDNISDSGAAVDYTTAVNWVNPNILESPTNRGDGAPDGAFVHCTTSGAAPCEDSDLINVVAVKIYVLVRATEASLGYTDTKTYTLGGLSLGPFNDGFKRHVYSKTVRLMNVAGRRETP